MKFLIKNNTKALTLVEVIVSVAILSIIVLPFLGTILMATRNNEASKQKLISTNLLQKAMEDLKSRADLSSFVVGDFQDLATYEDGGIKVRYKVTEQDLSVEETPEIGVGDIEFLVKDSTITRTKPESGPSINDSILYLNLKGTSGIAEFYFSNVPIVTFDSFANPINIKIVQGVGVTQPFKINVILQDHTDSINDNGTIVNLHWLSTSNKIVPGLHDYSDPLNNSNNIVVDNFAYTDDSEIPDDIDIEFLIENDQIKIVTQEQYNHSLLSHDANGYTLNIQRQLNSAKYIYQFSGNTDPRTLTFTNIASLLGASYNVKIVRGEDDSEHVPSNIQLGINTELFDSSVNVDLNIVDDYEYNINPFNTGSNLFNIKYNISGSDYFNKLYKIELKAVKGVDDINVLVSYVKK